MIKLKDILKVLQEASKTGAMTGTQEKELSTGLRAINFKYKDPSGRMITDKTPHSEINYGGCGIFAKLLYYNLRKYLNITPEIVLFDFADAEQLDHGEINRYSSLEEFNEDEHTCVHIVLKVGNQYIDSSGIHSLSWFKNRVYGHPVLRLLRGGLIEQEGMTIQTLSKWVRTAGDWNDTFDRYSTGDINKDMVDVMKQLSKK